MKKIYLALIFIGILGISSPLLAEESGFFMGAQLGKGGVELNYKYCAIYQPGNPAGQPKKEEHCSTEHQQDEQDKVYNSFLAGERHDFKSTKYGFLAGYKQFFTPKFGLRYYAAFNVGKYQYNGKAYQRSDKPPLYEWEFRTTYTHKISEQHLSVNVDALYDFITNDIWDFGVFGGVSLGYVWYQYDMNEGVNWYYWERGYKQIDKMQDFDIGLNLGLRVNLIKRHGIEFYSRFSLMKQRETYIIIPLNHSATNLIISPQR